MAMPETSLENARQVLHAAKQIVFFTGAGISAESGIPTFRDADGLWSKYPPDQFGNMPGLLETARRDTVRFVNFLCDFLAPLVNAVPNSAHHAISTLQKVKSVTVVTQNVDGLHQRAGTEGVIEIHGSIFERINSLTNRIESISLPELKELLGRLDTLRRNRTSDLNVLKTLHPIVSFDDTGMWQPNVILFGQNLPVGPWEAAEEAVCGCDCLVVVGTSRAVFPAASLIDRARHPFAKIIHVDLEAKGGGLSLCGSAQSVLPPLCAC